MSSFALDTSGRVATPWGLYKEKIASHNAAWSDLNPFEQGYIEALFASASLDTAHARDCEYVTSEGPAGCSCAAGRFGYRRPLRFDWLSPEALARIIADCARFCESWLGGPNPYTATDREAGGLLWVKRGEGSLPDFPPLTPTLGDDGKVYLAEVQS